MRRLLSFCLLVLFCALAPVAQAQDRPATILVLDASGSMWGQIDGVNKIVIAREVISDLLTRIPETMELGLTMYGHNRRGDCSDIETMVPPGVGNRDQIAQIVNTVNPRGRTPLSAAVIQAAEQLRYTENPATVILVSDGRETCDADPCAVGRALEEAGIDFTAHVVGFDVAEPEDIAQLQCLADNTGGQFLTASNADELAEALDRVAVAPPPAPILSQITFRAVVEPDNSAPVSPLIWEVFDASGQVVIPRTEAPTLMQPLPAGDYQVWLYRVAQETTHGGPFTVVAGQDQTVIVPLPQLVPEASLMAPAEAPVGTSVPVQWSGPGAPEDYLLLALPDRSASLVQVFPRDGNPLMVTLPDTAGDYLLQYVHPALNRVLAERPIRAVPLPATITAPATAVAGSTIAVTWDGPGGEDDMITAAIVSQDRNVTRVYTRDGNPAQLRVPSQARDYELRYIDGTGRVLATAPLTVTPASATIEAPNSAPMGSTISVAWTGPAYEPDQIVIARPGETRVLNRIYMRDGTPQDMLLPPVAGQYELRYLMQDDEEVIATRPITVTQVLATLEAPAAATAGSTIRVDWTGPDYANDFIGIGRINEPDRYANYAYTRDGSPASLLMPAEPGDYEIRYFMNQDRTVIARHPITVSDVVATLEAPASAEAGSTVRVHWTGPDYANDFIGVGRMDEPDRYENYAYTRDGSPAALLMPAEPGDYEIRYFVNQDRTVIARHPITVSDVVATLEAPESAPAGSTVSVTWTGPDYQNDFIGVGRMDQPDRYENYAYTRDGSPARVEMPTAPGTYELRYFVNQDRTVIARRVIEVTEVGASLEAPEMAPAGSTVSVTWTGPDYQNDFIGVGRMDEPDRYENYAYTRDGSPARVEMPTAPGTYELRYFVNQDRTVIARRVIEVTALSVTLSAPPSASVGETVSVTWEGPDYRNDFIAASLPDDDGYETYTYTRDGNPARLQMPSEPGSYEIRYFVNQDRTVVARIPVTVADIVATLSADPSGVAGGSVMVAFEGPNYRNDYIAISRADDPDGYETYGYTRDGNPVRVTLPDEPGAYEIRYVMNQDRRILGRIPFTVTAP